MSIRAYWWRIISLSIILIRSQNHVLAHPQIRERQEKIQNVKNILTILHMLIFSRVGFFTFIKYIIIAYEYPSLLVTNYLTEYYFDTFADTGQKKDGLPM